MSAIEIFLDSAAKAYYAGAPIISDLQFDHLAESVNYSKLGAEVVSGQKSGMHYHPMYSLQKYYEDENASAPLDGTKIPLVITPKLDGAAISLLYIDGELTQVLTRGDGKVGLDKTDKFLASNHIPKRIRPGIPVFQVTGEIVAPKHVENARNYAAGAINLKDTNEFRTRAISFFAYDCYPHLHDTYDEELVTLEKMGFNTVRMKNLIEIYPCDGVVFRVNSHAKAEELGMTSKHPKFAYALKTRQDCVETQILSVEWNVGRTGRVTPVAILAPVKVDEKIVSRATLNNPAFIEAMDLRIGDTVGVRLAGMIIPEIAYKCSA